MRLAPLVLQLDIVVKQQRNAKKEITSSYFNVCYPDWDEKFKTEINQIAQ